MGDEFTQEDEIPRWTVNHHEDMEFVRNVYDCLTERGYWVFGQSPVLKLVERDPDLFDINRDL